MKNFSIFAANLIENEKAGDDWVYQVMNQKHRK
jgi:hypothetical protein